MLTTQTWRIVVIVVSSIIVMAASFLSPSWAQDIAVSSERNGRVARAMFTTDIVEREPVDKVLTLENTVNSVYFFTDLRNLGGQTVTHQWEYEGEIVSVVSFKIGGPRWRVYSKKVLDPTMLGRWTVLVLDGSGWPLHASIFLYKGSGTNN